MKSLDINYLSKPVSLGQSHEDIEKTGLLNNAFKLTIDEHQVEKYISYCIPDGKTLMKSGHLTPVHILLFYNNVFRKITTSLYYWTNLEYSKARDELNALFHREYASFHLTHGIEPGHYQALDVQRSNPICMTLETGIIEPS